MLSEGGLPVASPSNGVEGGYFEVELHWYLLPSGVAEDYFEVE